MAKKKKSSKRPAKRTAKKSASKKATPKKRTVKKPKAVAKKSKPVKKKPTKKAGARDGLLLRRQSWGRPICTSGHGYLDDCMPWNRADAIARKHEADFEDCSVDVEKC